MADVVEAILGLTYMEVDTHDDSWGAIADQNWGYLLSKVTGRTAHSTTGGTVTPTQAQLRNTIQRVTGVLASNSTFEIAAAYVSWWLFENATTGAFTLTVKVTGQTGVVIPPGEARWVFNNGTDVVDVPLANSAKIGNANWVGTLAGSATAMTAAANNEVPAVLRDGMVVRGIIANANSGTTPTFNYGATGAKTILLDNGVAPAIGDLALGAVVDFTYVLSADKWYATVRPILGAYLGAGNNIAFTGANSHAGIETFTRGIIAAPTVLTDAATVAWNMANTSPNVVLTATSGVGATRAMGAPSSVNVGQYGTIRYVQDGTGSRALTWNAVYKHMGTQVPELAASGATIWGYYALDASNIIVWPLHKTGRSSLGFYKEYDMGTCAFPGTKTQAHGLGQYPASVEVWLQCTSTDIGYSSGDRVQIAGYSEDGSSNRAMTVVVNTTNVIVKSCANEIRLTNGSSADTITASRWKVIARVYD